MSFAIRVCRHCKAAVSMDAATCQKCHKQLMSPMLFKATLAVMVGVILVVYSGLVGAYLMLENAKDQLYCQKPFYHRDIVSPETTCTAVCTAACAQVRGAAAGDGVLLSTGVAADSFSITLSCECACSAC